MRVRNQTKLHMHQKPQIEGKKKRNRKEKKIDLSLKYSIKINN